jgi:hypothetical protein
MNDLPADAWPVQRLDREASYVLVRLGEAGESGWLAAVDPATSTVMTWAKTAGATTVPSPPPAMKEVEDRELVWQPSAQTRSPLYPLLRLTTRKGPLFVDLSGKVWTRLNEGRA